MARVLVLYYSSYGHIETIAQARKELLLEALTIVAASTITNYTGSVAKPPLDAPFQKYLWSAA